MPGLHSFLLRKMFKTTKKNGHITKNSSRLVFYIPKCHYSHHVCPRMKKTGIKAMMKIALKRGKQNRIASQLDEHRVQKWLY